MITKHIFDWAEQTPEKTAVIYNGRPWSYRSFAQRIAIARGYFARRGCVGPGCAVLAVHNLLDFWVLSLALRSLGLTTATVPSSPAIHGLGLPDVRCVVTVPAEAWPGLDSLCAAQGLRMLSVSLDGEPALKLGASEGPNPPGGHILHTSGTTGVYKMVLMSPAIDAVFLRRKTEVIGINQDTVLSVFHFPAWTAAGYRWAASPWTVGGATLIEQGREPYQALLRPGVTHAVLVPAMLAAILAAPPGAFPRNDAMQLAVGGGAMTRTQVDQAKARITPRLFNWLASTEGGGIAYTLLDTAEDLRWHRLAPGRVVEIVDDSDRPVPTGEIGRVRVGTAGGPTSYLRDKTATQAFFKDGFFYPGDLAVMRSDGRMALQGRLTDVVNVKGFKISPAPVEERLSGILGVSGVCLLSMPDDSGEEQIHVVFEAPEPIDSERLIAILGEQLRGFPQARVHFVAALPRNEMGKVLRQAVRAQVLSLIG
ncbi:MAG TPA: class I adenylate-forming enzyme family protein [Methylocystis sp.]|nr:class I adenylate-forming enzyme family protein [Methylocystis sp.]